MGAGGCAAAWLIKKKGDQSGQLFVGKVFKGSDKMCKMTWDPECTALNLVKHPGCVTLEETFGNGENGSAMILELCKGKDLQKVINTTYKDKAVPKDILIDWLL